MVHFVSRVARMPRGSSAIFHHRRRPLDNSEGVLSERKNGKKRRGARGRGAADSTAEQKADDNRHRLEIDYSYRYAFLSYTTLFHAYELFTVIHCCIVEYLV